MKVLFAIAFVLAGAALAADTPLRDPVADFLSLPIKDRYTDGSEVVTIYRASIDIDSDGSPETLVGHHKMWWGDNDGIYWAIYTKDGDHFKRLTKPDEDVRLQLYDGNPDFMYVGGVTEQRGAGLLMAVPLLQRSDEKAELIGIEHLIFTSIENGHAITKELPGLDFSKEADKAFYKKYFAQAGHQGGFAVEKISAKQLKEQGYRIPNWKTAPKATDDSTSSTGPAPSLQAQKVVTSAVSAKQPAPKARSDQVEQPTIEQPQSTSWALVIVLIVAAGGLLWLLLKRRS